jgi:hypothetical protein
LSDKEATAKLIKDNKIIIKLVKIQDRGCELAKQREYTSAER